jgi:acid phosphatase type 7
MRWPLVNYARYAAEANSSSILPLRKGEVTRLRQYATITMVLVAMLLSACGKDYLGSTPESELQSETVSIVGAGDIAQGSNNQDEATAQLIRNRADATVFTAGDNAYNTGTLEEFNSYYEPTWGAFIARTHPTPGNHEYDHGSGTAAGYHEYFGTAAGERGKGYYSYDVGSWHALALNTNCNEDRDAICAAQAQWIRETLSQNSAKCEVAYGHHPLFSSGSHGNQAMVRPLWDALYDHGADVIIAAHDHTYERFALQNPSGARDNAEGIRQFVVGTGGATLYSWGTIRANSQFRDNTRHGVLELTLRDGSYAWRFVDTSGVVVDRGTGTCH